MLFILFKRFDPDDLAGIEAKVPISIEERFRRGGYMKESRKDRCRRKVRDALESSTQPVSTSALARAARVSRNTTASCLAELRCQGLAKSYDVGSTRIWMVA